MNRWGDMIADRIADLFESSERPAKKGGGRPPNGDAAASSKGNDRKQPRVPVEAPAPPQQAWIEDVLSKTMRTFAEAVDERASATEARVNSLEQKMKDIEQLRERLDQIELRDWRAEDMPSSWTEEFEKAKKEMAEEIKAATDAAKAAAREDAGATPIPATVPYEQRELAIMGALGWDESRQTLLQRCKEVLAEAGLEVPT